MGYLILSNSESNVSVYTTPCGQFCKASAGVLSSGEQTAIQEGLKKILKYSTSTKNSGLSQDCLLQFLDVLSELHNTKCAPHNALRVMVRILQTVIPNGQENLFQIFVRQVPKGHVL